jgi:hypothetical protein
VLRKDLAALAGAALEQPCVRLLPYFDSFLLAHANREHLVAAAHHQKVYRPQGWVAPVVLVDGRVAGTWDRSMDGSRLNVKVTPLAPLARRFAASLRPEARDLGRFLGTANVEVQIAE